MASVGVSQIKRVEEFIASRQRVCRAYNDAFCKKPGLKIPQSDFSEVSPFIYSLRVLDGRREALIAHLQNLAVDVGIHFIPVHKHTYFAQCRRSTSGNTVGGGGSRRTPLWSLEIHRLIELPLKTTS